MLVVLNVHVYQVIMMIILKNVCFAHSPQTCPFPSSSITVTFTVTITIVIVITITIMIITVTITITITVTITLTTTIAIINYLLLLLLIIHASESFRGQPLKSLAGARDQCGNRIIMGRANNTHDINYTTTNDNMIIYIDINNMHNNITNNSNDGNNSSNDNSVAAGRDQCGSHQKLGHDPSSELAAPPLREKLRCLILVEEAITQHFGPARARSREIPAFAQNKHPLKKHALRLSNPSPPKISVDEVNNGS